MAWLFFTAFSWFYIWIPSTKWSKWSTEMAQKDKHVVGEARSRSSVSSRENAALKAPVAEANQLT